MALPADELELISKKLTFGPDYTRFRSVCKSWRSAAPKHPQLPWLIVYNQTGSTMKINFFNFYTFSFETNKFTPIPELSESPILASSKNNSTVCIGYSHGWVALVDLRSLSTSLSNPLTNRTIDLPNLQTWENTLGNCGLSLENWDSIRDLFYSDGFSFDLTSDPAESLSNCFASIYWSRTRRIFYCKVGCGGWIQMQCPYISSEKHILSYQGKLFIASGVDMFVCDFGQNPSVREIASVKLYDTEINERLYRSYLVESDGDLLFVHVYGTGFEETVDITEHDSFRIFRLNSEGQSARLVEVNSLGDKALFLSMGSTFSLTASMHPGCKGNSIYWTRMSLDDTMRRLTQKLRIYDFERLSRGLIKADVVPTDLDSRRCFWFAPSLLP